MEMSISMWKSESQTSSSSRTVSRPFPSHFEKLTKNGHGRVEGRWPTYCQRRALSTVYSKVERGHFRDMTFLPYVARYQRLHDPPRSQSHRQKISVSYFRYNGFMNSGRIREIYVTSPHTSVSHNQDVHRHCDFSIQFIYVVVSLSHLWFGSPLSPSFPLFLFSSFRLSLYLVFRFIYSEFLYFLVLFLIDHCIIEWETPRKAKC